MATPIVTEPELKKMSSRQLSVVQTQPRLLQPDTWANIKAYSSDDLKVGDRVKDTTMNGLWEWDGTWWIPVGTVGGSFVDIQIASDPTKFGFTKTTATGTVGQDWTGDTSGVPATRAVLAATDEAETVEISFGDIRGWNFALGGHVFDFLVNVTTAPTGANEFITFGMGAAVNADIEAVTGRVFFQLEHDGATGAQLVFVCDDNASVVITDAVSAAGETALGTGQWVRCRIDASDSSDIRFLIEGTDYTDAALAAATGPPTAFDMSAAGWAVRNLQPIFHLHKDSGTAALQLKLARFTAVSNPF